MNKSCKLIIFFCHTPALLCYYYCWQTLPFTGIEGLMAFMLNRLEMIEHPEIMQCRYEIHSIMHSWVQIMKNRGTAGEPLAYVTNKNHFARDLNWKIALQSTSLEPIDFLEVNESYQLANAYAHALPQSLDSCASRQRINKEHSIVTWDTNTSLLHVWIRKPWYILIHVCPVRYEPHNSSFYFLCQICG